MPSDAAMTADPLPLPGHVIEGGSIRWLAPPANFNCASGTRSERDDGRHLAQYPYPLAFRTARVMALSLALTALTSCSFLSRHQFALPSKEWQTRTGQLQYRTGGVTVTGDVVVRLSKQGDFELTFSKGPGINLFTIQQDANFAEVKSSLSRQTWSGQTDQAPQQLRGWLSLREKLMAAPQRKVVRHDTGTEKFVFRF